MFESKLTKRIAVLNSTKDTDLKKSNGISLQDNRSNFDINNVIQRAVTVQGKTVRGTDEIPKVWQQEIDKLTDDERQLVDLYIYESKNYTFEGIENFISWIKKGKMEDPTKKRLIEAHRARNPYQTDALFEGTSLMRGVSESNLWLPHRGGLVLKGLLSPSTWAGNSSRPSYKITKIKNLENPNQKKRFEVAHEMLRGTIRTTYFGHANTKVINTIIKTGHDPAYTSHGGSKGYGALGLGTYSTTLLDKAISYSSKGKRPGQFGIVLEQKVLIGQHAISTENADKFRHDTHDRMKDDNLWSKSHPNFKARNRGPEAGSVVTPYPIAQTPTSIIGKPSTVPGRSLPRLAMTKALYGTYFDSEEILVRNPDQVLPVAAIYFQVQ